MFKVDYYCIIVEMIIEEEVRSKERHLFLLNPSGKYDIIQDSEPKSRLLQKWSHVLQDTFLPQNYPESVKPEYIEYQFWDSLQALCSYLRSVLTTKSVLQGAGVGSSTATPIAAAIAWIAKDGIGMISSLTLAYFSSSSFESYSKEWRLFADFLNNVGLALDLFCSIYPELYFVLIVISSASKACCGLIAGATKARISAHFARKGYLADVNAKESTQETAVALIGLILGIWFAKLIGDDDQSVKIWFTLFLILHMYCNYRLVKVLVFNTLNPQRVYLICAASLRNGAIDSKTIASMETLFRPIHLMISGPIFAGSISDIIGGCFSNNSSFDTIRKLWNHEKFIIGLNKRNRIVISFEKHSTDQEIIKSYYLASYIWIKLTERKLKDKKEYYLQFCKFAEESKGWYDQFYQNTLAKSDWELDDASPLGVIRYHYYLSEAADQLKSFKQS